MKRDLAQKRHSGGFTLVEVMIVMVILVLLAGLVVPGLLGKQKKAKIQTAKAQIGGFKGALEHYALEMDTFPTTEQGLESLVEEPQADDERTGNGKSKWDGPYLNADDVPADPWGNDYQYEYPPTHGKRDSPDIWSFGPDGEDDTEDDIVSWKKVSEDGEFVEEDDEFGDSVAPEDR